MTLRPRLAAATSITTSSSISTSSSHISLWPVMSIACIALLSASSTILPNSVADAAPAKQVASKNVANAMNALSISATSALPLQLQIEAQTAGAQKLAYLPTSGPSLDFYYLNYRPTYIAGESKIDFWMLTPQGSGEAPKTASLELYDEFGKIRLAVLVPEGTEIPKALADKHEPFLWKSWQIPKNIKSDFDFSEKFRIVLKTSDSKTVPVNKRADTAAGAASAVVVVAQDRQFKIKGLQASPGGKPHPAKVNVNSVAVATPNKATTNTNINTNANAGVTSSNNSNSKGNTDTDKPAAVAGGVDNSSNNNNNNGNSNTKAKASSASSMIASRVAVPLMIVAASTFASLC
ncbi:hypothetical protein BGX26_009095 [Mortierella sp. AD094]|nr:hypothetical protein BGX26_009095 [Mortierella sp. AD094]